jgi:hypothetical protein
MGSASLTEGSIWRSMLVFAFPVLLSNLLQLFYDTFDAWTVGYFLGDSALAAVGSSSSLIFLLVGFCNGNPIDHTCMKNPKQEFFNGRIVAVVRALRKGEGKAEVVIKADKLPELIVPIQVKKATRAQLLH